MAGFDIEATQPGRCGWPSGGTANASIHGGVPISWATMLRARASCRAAPSCPRAAAAACTSSMFAFVIASTDGEPGR